MQNTTFSKLVKTTLHGHFEFLRSKIPLNPPLLRLCCKKHLTNLSPDHSHYGLILPKFDVNLDFLRLPSPLLSSSVFWSTTSYVNLAALYGMFSLLIRIELSVSGNFLFATSEGSGANGFYRAVTSHGVGMVFLFIMPGIISALGNWAIPHTYSGIDFATPRLNNLAF